MLSISAGNLGLLERARLRSSDQTGQEEDLEGMIVDSVESMKGEEKLEDMVNDGVGSMKGRRI